MPLFGKYQETIETGLGSVTTGVLFWFVFANPGPTTGGQVARAVFALATFLFVVVLLYRSPNARTGALLAVVMGMVFGLGFPSAAGTPANLECAAFVGGGMGLLGAIWIPIRQWVIGGRS